jgi:hypothetical protein
MRMIRVVIRVVCRHHRCTRTPAAGTAGSTAGAREMQSRSPCRPPFPGHAHLQALDGAAGRPGRCGTGGARSGRSGVYGVGAPKALDPQAKAQTGLIEPLELPAARRFDDIA